MFSVKIRVQGEAQKLPERLIHTSDNILFKRHILLRFGENAQHGKLPLGQETVWLRA